MNTIIIIIKQKPVQYEEENCFYRKNTTKLKIWKEIKGKSHRCIRNAKKERKKVSYIGKDRIE